MKGSEQCRMKRLKRRSWNIEHFSPSNILLLGFSPLSELRGEFRNSSLMFRRIVRARPSVSGIDPVGNAEGARAPFLAKGSLCELFTTPIMQ